MTATTWSRSRPAIFVLLLSALLLTACGQSITNENWPGLTSNGDRAYISFGPGVFAVDIPERQVVWSFPEEFGGQGEIYAALSILDGRIVVGDYGQAGGFLSPGLTVTIYALDDIETGNTPPVLWSNTESASDKIIAQASQSGSSGFVGTADNYVLSLDVDSGQELWRYKTGQSIWGQPTYQDGVVYVPSLDKSVYALDSESGAVIWQTTVDGSFASKPVLDDENVYVSSFDHSIHALDINTGEIKWTSAAEDLVWGAPTLGDGLIFYGDIDGNIFAVDLNGELAWQQQLEGGLIQTAPAYHEGVLYVVSNQVGSDEEERVGQVLALDATDGSEIWRRATPTPIMTSPVVIGDELVVAPLKSSSLLLVFDLESGDLVWEFVPPASE